MASLREAFSGLESLAGSEIQHLLSENCWLVHCLSSPVQRIALAPLPSMEAFHFEQHAYRHQWRVSDNPLHGRVASFHAPLVLDVPVNLFHGYKNYMSMHLLHM